MQGIHFSCMLSLVPHPFSCTFHILKPPRSFIKKPTVVTSLLCWGCTDKKTQARKTQTTPNGRNPFFFSKCSLYCARLAKLNTKTAFLPKTAAVWKNYSPLSQCLALKKSHFKLERTGANMAARTKWCL